MSYFTAEAVGFHVRHSPDNNMNYVWEASGDAYGLLDDHDASKYGTLVEACHPPVIEATIDIKPGSDVTPIHPRSRGRVPVAILTSENLDASTVDPATVSFAGATPLRWSTEDVNGDDHMDMILFFATQELSLTPNDFEAYLTGETFDGEPLAGSDTVKVKQ